MTDYPRLAEMGVLHPRQIAYFSVNSIGYDDYLRIVYERPKGSFLPTSRSYRFPRQQVELVSDAGSSKTDVVMESSPEFREAVAELEVIMSTKESKHDLAAMMLDEVRQLEEEFSMHTEYLKDLIEKVRVI